MQTPSGEARELLEAIRTIDRAVSQYEKGDRSNSTVGIWLFLPQWQAVRDALTPTEPLSRETPADEAREAQVIDLDRSFWESLVKAAGESSWIPPEYYANDWVSDCCNFLRNGPLSRETVEQAACYIKDWRNGHAGEDTAEDTARLVLSLCSSPPSTEPVEGEIERLREALEEAARDLNRIYHHTFAPVTGYIFNLIRRDAQQAEASIRAAISSMKEGR